MFSENGEKKPKIGKKRKLSTSSESSLSDDYDDANCTAAMGADPTLSNKIKVPLTKAMVIRWTHWIKQGVDPERLSILLEQYQVPNFLNVPELNLELKGYLKANALKQDEHLSNEQILISRSLVSAAGTLYTLIRQNSCKSLDEPVRLSMIQMNTESVELQAHWFYEKTLTRKAFVIRAVQNPGIKDVLKEQTTDEFLFGKDFAEKLRKYKYVQKTSMELAAAPKNPADHFLEQRSSHPARNNQYWESRDSQKDRWSFGKSPFPFPTSNYRGTYNTNYRGRGRGRGRSQFRK